MKPQRDYNQEFVNVSGCKYAYNFDFDVMHPFMLRSFAPFFKSGNLLELRSFKGDSTKRVILFFDGSTCVEASDNAVKIVKKQIGEKAKFINSLFEAAPAELERGRRVTYTLDTLERDARESGLRVVGRSGIFFKAPASFQWDKLLKTDIVSPEYLERCYQLGQQYPDLCSSIFLMCEKGIKVS